MATHPDPVTLAAEPGIGAVQFASRRVDGGGAALRLTLGYRRSADFDPRDDAGQDHAVVRAAGGRAVGVVADGVGQSFFGDIAARCVAEGLADYLWRHASQPPTADAVARELARLRAAARGEVETRPIPTDVPELARTGLERLRRSAGSQAVFAAFVLEGARHVAHIYTVGDAGTVLHGSPGTSLAVPQEPRGRWSTHGAPVLGLRADRYAGVSAVVVRSDGARDWGDVLPGADAERAFRHQAPRLAGYDDVAFVLAQVEGGAAPSAPLALVASERVERLPGAEPEPEAPAAIPVREPSAAHRPPPPPLRPGRGTEIPVVERERRAALPALPGLGRPAARRAVAAAALLLLVAAAGTGAQRWMGRGADDAAAKERDDRRPMVIPRIRDGDPVAGVHPAHPAPVQHADGDGDTPYADEDAAVLSLDGGDLAAANPGALEPAAAGEVEPGEDAVPPSAPGTAGSGHGAGVQPARPGRLPLSPGAGTGPARPPVPSGHVEGGRREDTGHRPPAEPRANRTRESADSRDRVDPRRRAQPERQTPTRPAAQPQGARARQQAVQARSADAAPAEQPVAPVPVPAARTPGAPTGPAAPLAPPRPDTPRTRPPHIR